MMTSLQDPAERQLVARIARADRAALGQLHEAYYPRLARLFTHLASSPEPAAIENLIEDTMFNVWQTPQSCRDADSVYAWVMGLAMEQARRSVQIEPPRSSEPDGFVYALFAPLSIEERAVVHLVYSGHECQDVAAIMSVSCTQVRALLSQARTAMRGLAAAPSTRATHPVRPASPTARRA